ncbi:MAG: hypothetical protein ACKVIQ_05605 [Acidimicrobiales bacterium]
MTSGDVFNLWGGHGGFVHRTAAVGYSFWDCRATSAGNRLNSDGYNYVSEGYGYCPNVTNQNSAVSLSMNNEFAPGTGGGP